MCFVCCFFAVDRAQLLSRDLDHVIGTFHAHLTAHAVHGPTAVFAAALPSLASVDHLRDAHDAMLCSVLHHALLRPRTLAPLLALLDAVPTVLDLIQALLSSPHESGKLVDKLLEVGRGVRGAVRGFVEELAMLASSEAGEGSAGALLVALNHNRYF